MGNAKVGMQPRVISCLPLIGFNNKIHMFKAIDTNVVSDIALEIGPDPVRLREAVLRLPGGSQAGLCGRFLSPSYTCSCSAFVSSDYCAHILARSFELKTNEVIVI